MIAKPHQWPLTAVAVAACLVLGAGQASALSLGRINVLSSIGEPLRAEIDILDINAEEAASLSAKVASPEAFKAAGLDYSSAMTSLQASLQRRADGRAYLLLNSKQRINDPFIDMILETSWASGRIVRDYTLLFDPPNLRALAVTPPALTQPPAPAATATRPAAAGAIPVAPSAKTPSKVQPVGTPAPTPLKEVAGKSSITIKAGDTASKIAAANKAQSLSLDQMLVALLRANPHAFIQQNVNWIKAGAVLSLPTQTQAAAVSPEQARQIIIAQSRDFNAFRQSLASSVPTTQVTPAQRSAGGKVEATVDDKKAATTVPDKLTLSKTTVQGKTSEEQLAQAGNAKELSQRADELTKNISELDKLASATGTAAAPASAASTPPKPAITPKVVPLPAPTPETGFIDELLDNPLLPAAAGGLLALFAGLGWYKLRQRRKASLDSSFNESRLQPESFFGVSGAKNVDTRDNPPTGSSMLYSPSQLDAVDDFDPVAEAAVYMAYGRDLQAEEILKDALRDNPERLTIHRKLLEIYAKRRDAKAFETIALLAAKLTQATGTEWESICAMGLVLDPNNALYQSHGASTKLPSATPALDDDATETGAVTEAMPLPPVSHAVDLDLDLDSPLGATRSGPAASAASTPDALTSNIASTDHSGVSQTPTVTPGPATDALADDFDFSLPALDSTPAVPAGNTPVAAAATPVTDDGMLEFDLGNLSLELNPSPSQASPNAGAPEASPLETKLALAEEFRAIGDEDGARALIQEVIAEAADDMKAKAQRALNKL